MKQLRVALAGNPNTGKSTIFNSLTGSQQHVGNWPGKTVARKAGYFDLNHEVRVEMIDLPGTYSLSAYSPEEQVARDYIIGGEPDLVVNVLDAANLERNLYLTAQILETGAPMILVLNMADVAAGRGYRLDIQALSRKLHGIPVLQATATKGRGLDALRDALLDFVDNQAELEGIASDDRPSRLSRFRQLQACH